MKKKIMVWESGYGSVTIDVPDNASEDVIADAVREALHNGEYQSDDMSYSYEADLLDTGDYQSIK